MLRPFRPTRPSRTYSARGMAVLVCSLTVALSGALVVPATSAPSAGGTSTLSPRLVDGTVSTSGVRRSTAVVTRNLAVALRMADRGRRVTRDARPAAKRLRSDSWTLPTACTAEPGERRNRICPIGDVDATRTVVLLGNSHMAMWMAGLSNRASRQGVRVLPFIKYGCSPFTFQMMRDGTVWRECSAWRDWAIAKITRIQPDLVVAGSHTWLSIAGHDGRSLTGPAFDRAWTRGVAGLSKQLAPSSGRMVVLGDTTERRRDPGPCALSRRNLMKECEQRLTARTRQLTALTAQGATAGGATSYDTNLLTCLRRRCPIVAGGTFVFRDERGHVSATYSRQVAVEFASAIGLTS